MVDSQEKLVEAANRIKTVINEYGLYATVCIGNGEYGYQTLNFPDESLAQYHEVTPDKSIITIKVPKVIYQEGNDQIMSTISGLINLNKSCKQGANTTSEILDRLFHYVEKHYKPGDQEHIH